MRNKYYILGALVSLVVLLVGIFLVLLLGGSNESISTGDTFPDTGAERPLTTNTDEASEPSRSDWVRTNSNKSTAAPAYRMVALGPVAGAVAYTRYESGGATSFVRYVERASGYVYETPLQRVESPAAITNKTVLRVREVVWSRNGSSTALRYLDDMGETIGAYAGRFKTASGSPAVGVSTQELAEMHLPNNIISAAYSPSGDRILYIEPTESGSRTYVQSVPSGAKTVVWTSGLRNLTVEWPSEERALMYTNPSSVADGFVWLVNPRTKSVEAVLGNETALAAKLSPSGSKILYSMREEEKGLASLRVLDLGTKKVTYLPMPTIVEKCTWASGGLEYVYCAVPKNMNESNFLERWYQGSLTSDDTIWRFDTTTGESKDLFDPTAAVQSAFDIINLSLSSRNDYLVFRSKATDQLWALELPAVPTAGSATSTTP